MPRKIETATQAQEILAILVPMRNHLKQCELKAGCEEPIQTHGKSVDYDMPKLEKMGDALEALGVDSYGNKGRSWSRTGCITGLDHIKGECNPRLAFNSCSVYHIGCPECLKTLHTLANPNWKEETGQ